MKLVQVQKIEKLQNTLVVLKATRIIQCAVILYLAIVHLVIAKIYLVSKLEFYGQLQYAYFTAIKAIVCVIFTAIQTSVVKRNKRVKVIYAVVIINTIFVIALIADLAYFQRQFDDVNYGPLTVINGNQTQIHWYTSQKSQSIVSLDNKVFMTNTRTHFHNVLVNETNFNFKVNGFSENSFNYSLPAVTSKFIVMTDIHGNGKYLNNMTQDYDFALLCGDYSSGGMAHEFSRSFKQIHKKPVIMAVGNHDALGDIDKLVTRQTNFYQKIGQNGYYFIYVLNTDLFHHSRVNESRVDEAIQFLQDNPHLSQNDENVFIVSHQAVYSTGHFGSVQYFTNAMEKYLNEHEHDRIRAVFSGHDHLFSAFKRDNVYYFVNGAGGGPVNKVGHQGDRSWEKDELSGPQPVTSSRTIGYDSHLNSYTKYTRTEVEFAPGKIVYVVRDLETNKVLNTFEQTIE
ncbi:Alkaline_phosphatase [Hexamita inflata]|uniref:Alkaline phosphatase n=1 Tax=Hexamita inflata TaxID=28002 RepID=A0AA86TJ92_9EUKA|nr:Alkaline phosphatase [Hexamita inflata]